MTDIKISALSQSTVLFLFSERESIDIDPEYQRESDIWPLAKKQLLIDSVINGFDLPKFYFQEHQIPLQKGQVFFRYGVIDGKQRLAALWSFIEGKLTLSDDFVYFREKSLKLAGKTYNEIASEFPQIKIRFDSYNLSVVTISSNSKDLELVEEMFFRLNEAEPLNAPEKRNARSGPLPKGIRQIAQHDFFIKRVKLSGGRYRYLDLAAKFLLFEKEGKVSDTKKVKLDRLVDEVQEEKVAQQLQNAVQANLDKLSASFENEDPLLKSVSMITLYYLYFRDIDIDASRKLRPNLLFFEKVRRENRLLAEGDEQTGKVDMDLIEFDRLAQSPNDKSALEFRLSTLRRFLKKRLSKN